MAFPARAPVRTTRHPGRARRRSRPERVRIEGDDARHLVARPAAARRATRSSPPTRAAAWPGSRPRRSIAGASTPASWSAPPCRRPRFASGWWPTPRARAATGSSRRRSSSGPTRSCPLGGGRRRGGRARRWERLARAGAQAVARRPWAGPARGPGARRGASPGRRGGAPGCRVRGLDRPARRGRPAGASAVRRKAICSSSRVRREASARPIWRPGRPFRGPCGSASGPPGCGPRRPPSALLAVARLRSAGRRRRAGRETA